MLLVNVKDITDPKRINSVIGQEWFDSKKKMYNPKNFFKETILKSSKRKRNDDQHQISSLHDRIKKNKSVSFKNIFEDVCVNLRFNYDKTLKNTCIPKTFELYDNDLYKETIGKGDAVLKRLRDSLDEFGFKRHTNQIHFHEEMIKACLRIIYRSDFEQNIDRVVQEVLIITARRIGKTTAVAIFAAALLMCVPTIELMIFSVSLNSSRKMLMMIQDFLEGHSIGNGMIKRPTNKDKITVIGGPNDRRTCESRPGRGQVSNLVFKRMKTKIVLSVCLMFSNWNNFISILSGKYFFNNRKLIFCCIYQYIRPY